MLSSRHALIRRRSSSLAAAGARYGELMICRARVSDCRLFSAARIAAEERTLNDECAVTRMPDRRAATGRHRGAVRFSDVSRSLGQIGLPSRFIYLATRGAWSMPMLPKMADAQQGAS